MERDVSLCSEGDSKIQQDTETVSPTEKEAEAEEEYSTSSLSNVNNLSSIQNSSGWDIQKAKKTPPKAGYTCKTCGMPGGLPDSHWFQLCPRKCVPHPTSVSTYQPPKDGYVCKHCGMPGGRAESHWFQQCPSQQFSGQSVPYQQHVVFPAVPLNYSHSIMMPASVMYYPDSGTAQNAKLTRVHQDSHVSGNYVLPAPNLVYFPSQMGGDSSSIGPSKTSMDFQNQNSHVEKKYGNDR